MTFQQLGVAAVALLWLVFVFMPNSMVLQQPELIWFLPSSLAVCYLSGYLIDRRLPNRIAVGAITALAVGFTVAIFGITQMFDGSFRGALCSLLWPMTPFLAIGANSARLHQRCVGLTRAQV